MARNDPLVNNFIDILGPSVRDIITRSGAGGRHPIPVDIVNEDTAMYVYVELPGVNKENIDVDFYNNKLSITAEKQRTYSSPTVSEIKFGRLERTLTLPICITRRDTVSVTYTNGILRIKINKLTEEENKFSMKPTD